MKGGLYHSFAASNEQENDKLLVLNNSGTSRSIQNQSTHGRLAHSVWNNEHSSQILGFKEALELGK